MLVCTFLPFIYSPWLFIAFRSESRKGTNEGVLVICLFIRGKYRHICIIYRDMLEKAVSAISRYQHEDVMRDEI